MIWQIILLVAAVVGLRLFLGERRRPAAEREMGWVYFLSPMNGEETDPPAPIKIGMTNRNPRERLPELATGSTAPLEIIQVIKTDVPAILESAIHKELAEYRRHGEWFDRDATMAWLDHYTGGR